MENQNTNQAPQVQGWKDVQIHSGLSVEALINFFNVLNQRLVNIEDSIVIKDADGNEITLTEFYYRQSEQELAAQQAQEQAEEK